LIGSYALLLCACAGGGAAPNPLPPDGIAGMNELIKGNERYQRGCYPRALEHFFKAHERFTASDHMAGIAMSMNNIGNAYRAVGDLESALLFYEEACLSYSALQNPDGALQSLSNKAAALIDAERFDAAEHELARAEKISGGSPRPFGPLLRNQGVLLFKKGDFPRARSFLDAALKNTEPHDSPEFAAVNFALGNLMLKTGSPVEAIRYFETALSADRSSSYYRGTADDLAAIGSIHYGKGDAHLAVGFFKRAVKIYALIQDRPKVDAMRDLLLEASQKAGLSSELTEFFVERWSRGDILENPCR